MLIYVISTFGNDEPVDEFKVKVFSDDEEKLKILGELLSNETSRNIIRLLIQGPHYTNQISNILDIRVSLVIHHLKKMEDLGILEITEKKLVKKGNPHRFFRMTPAFFILPNTTCAEIKEKGLLEKIFNNKTKVLSIFVPTAIAIGFLNIVLFFMNCPSSNH